jgi:hypothetical protein
MSTLRAIATLSPYELLVPLTHVRAQSDDMRAGVVGFCNASIFGHVKAVRYGR